MDTLTLPTNLNTSQYPIIDEDLLEKYKQNRAVSNTAYYILIIAYTILIIMGSIGNFFVITAIKSNKSKFILFFWKYIQQPLLKYSLCSNEEIGIPMYTYTYLQGDPNWTIVFLNQLMTLALALTIWYLIHIWKILCKTVQKPLFDLNHPVYLGTVHTYCIMHVINHIVSCPIIISVFAQNIVLYLWKIVAVW